MFRGPLLIRQLRDDRRRRARGQVQSLQVPGHHLCSVPWNCHRLLGQMPGGKSTSTAI